MTQTHFDRIIESYLKDIATAEEKIEQLAIEKLNETVFRDENDRKMVRERIFGGIKNEIGEKRQKRTSVRWLAAASIALLFSIGGWLLFRVNEPERIIVANDTTTPKIVKMPDGTIITLNKNSTLYYDTDYNQTARKVEFEGEAFFDVASNPQKPFIVKTGAVSTKVLGTAFNIAESDNNIKVTVTEGEVSVYQAIDTVRLNPNEQAVYNKHRQSLSEHKVNATISSLWMSENILLNDVTLSDITETLHQLYGVRFLFTSPELVDMKMTLYFEKREEIQAVIDRVNAINEVKFIKNRNNDIEIRTK